MSREAGQTFFFLSTKVDSARRVRRMKYSTLGSTGLQVSALCLGTATFGVAPAEVSAERLVHSALDLGMNFIDTANSYGNQSRFDRAGVPPAPLRPWAEELIGQALRGRRDRVVLASKVSEPVEDAPNSGSWTGGGMTRKHVVQQLETSLRRLQTDYLDIYHVHHPDPHTHVHEWIATMEDLIRNGKIRHYALSTFAAWESAQVIMEAQRHTWRSPACHQVRYNLIDREVEREVVPAARHYDLPLTAFSPLAGGLLSSSYGRSLTGAERWGGSPPTPAAQGVTERFHALIRTHGIPSEGAAIAWLLQRPMVASVIVGPEQINQLSALVEACSVSLDSELLAGLDGLHLADTK